jgi:hypothetical protein
MRLILSPSLLLLVSSQHFSLTQQEKSTTSFTRHLLKKSNRKNSRTNNPDNKSSNLQTCYYNLLSSSQYDSTLSQSDFLTFVDLQSLGVGITTSWGTNITSFYQLSPKFVGVYNQYACGDANIGCPSIGGIAVDSVYDLE